MNPYAIGIQHDVPRKTAESDVADKTSFGAQAALFSWQMTAFVLPLVALVAIRTRHSHVPAMSFVLVSTLALISGLAALLSLCWKPSGEVFFRGFFGVFANGAFWFFTIYHTANCSCG
jgi:hypothetical protein